MRKRVAKEHVLAARHLGGDLIGRGLFGAEPHDVERVLARLALAVDRDDVAQGDGVLSRVVKGAEALRREVLGDRKWRGRQRDPGERGESEVLLEVADERVADGLVEEHATGDERTRHHALVGAKQ